MSDGWIADLERERAVAIIRVPPALARAVVPALEAAARAGFRWLEVTLGTRGALEHIAAMAGRPGLTIGAGTVMTPEEARAAVEAGARFLVSPVVDEPVIAAAAQLGVPMIPGTQTPTEMLRAQRAGAEVIKLFPAPGTGPEYVRQVLGPMPSLRLLPTSGVTPDNAAAFLAAGAFAVGFGSPLFVPADLEGGDFARIEARARACLQAVDG